MEHAFILQFFELISVYEFVFLLAIVKFMLIFIVYFFLGETSKIFSSWWLAAYTHFGLGGFVVFRYV